MIIISAITGNSINQINFWGVGSIPLYLYLIIGQSSFNNQEQSPLLWFECLFYIQLHFATMIQDFNST